MSNDICNELGQNFLEYSYETNSNRAFPDVRDGLKPGQRAILWEMWSKGFTSNRPHIKCAKVSGGVAASLVPIKVSNKVSVSVMLETVICSMRRVEGLRRQVASSCGSCSPTQNLSLLKVLTISFNTIVS